MNKSLFILAFFGLVAFPALGMISTSTAEQNSSPALMRESTTLSVTFQHLETQITSFAQKPTENDERTASVRPAEDAKITKSNWRTHPRIEAVLAVVRSVNEGWEKREFKTSERRFEQCDNVFSELRRISVDQKGLVRRYEYQYAAEDDSRTDQFYYDEGGHLRFVLITGWNATIGQPARHRIYFDENGRRLWEDSKGQGLYWPKRWPDKELRKTDAAKDFYNTTRCAREVKSTSK